MTRPDAVRLALVAVAAVAAVAPIPPPFVERWYSRRLYASLQPLVTALSALVPFALLDVAVGAILLGVAIHLARSWPPPEVLPWLRRRLTGVVVFAAIVYLWFLTFWGLNYRRVPLEQKLAYEPSRISRAQALTMAWAAVERVNALAGAPPAAEDDQVLASALDDVQRSLAVDRMSRKPAPKRSMVTWYFQKAAIDGMTNPFFLEIIVVPELLPFERPHTLAHEWAHLAGYADESEANFIAWLACVRATPLAQYSGWLSAYQHVSRVLPREDREALRKALGPRVVADLQAMSARLARANPGVSRAARGAYDTYLRANRIEEGIANYGAVVRLLLGTQFDANWTAQLNRSHPF